MLFEKRTTNVMVTEAGTYSVKWVPAPDLVGCRCSVGGMPHVTGTIRAVSRIEHLATIEWDEVTGIAGTLSFEDLVVFLA